MLNADLCYIALWARQSFTNNKLAHVVYVYVILLFISVWLPRSWDIAICLGGIKRKNIWSTWSNCVSKWSFLV